MVNMNTNKNTHTQILSILLLAVILASTAAAAVTAVAQGEYIYPRQIIITVRTTESRGVLDVQDGKLDVFLWAVSPRVLKQINVDYSKIKLVPSSSGIYDLLFNPYSDDDEAGKWGVATNIDDGTKHFNPFALRKVRFAMNWLIGRKYIIENILAGGGTPMYVGVGESNPFYEDKFMPIIKELGLTDAGDEAKALKMIDEALREAAEHLAKLGYKLYKADDGYWHFQAPGQDDEIVTVTLLSRLEDARKDIGSYVASQIEKAGIKVNLKPVERLTAAITVYFSDPRKLEWHIYTEGWGSTSDYIWPADFLAFFASAVYYGFLPTFNGWQYDAEEAKKRNDTIQVRIEELGEKILAGKFKDANDYWKTCEELTKLAIEESIRVFLTENLEYYVVNQRVKSMAAGARTGLATPLALRTAKTPTGVLVVAEFSSQGALFMSAWNPVGGIDDMYSTLIWNQITDSVLLRHPVTGEPVPVRATWKIIFNATIPEDAIIYDHAKHEWVRTPNATEMAPVKVVYNYRLGYWHDGRPVTLFDILAIIAWYWEWSYHDGPEDKWYYDSIASSNQPFFETIEGIEIINETAIAVYGTYKHPVADYEDAAYYAFWMSLPPEIYKAMEYLVLFKGPVSGKSYGWGKGEGDRWLDLIDPDHQPDLRAALDKLTDYKAPWYEATMKLLPGHNEAAAISAIKAFAEKYGHMVDSNGPFVLTRYLPTELYLELTRFAKYPLPPDYYEDKVASYKVVVTDFEAPKTVIPPKFTVFMRIVKQYSYPDTYTEPAEHLNVYVKAFGETFEAEDRGDGFYKATITLPENVGTGRATLEVVVEEKGVVVARATEEVTVLAPQIGGVGNVTVPTITAPAGGAGGGAGGVTATVTVPSVAASPLPTITSVKVSVPPYTTYLVVGLVLAVVVGVGAGLALSRKVK